jgi:outer membrane protein OmpA-like peptidoglycan-associated protein
VTFPHAEREDYDGFEWSRIVRHAKPLLCTFVVALSGCTGTNSQLATCQAEKEQLLGTIRGQRETARVLETQVASLEKRLDQSEKELARGGSGTRISSRPVETATQSPSKQAPAATPTTPVPAKTSSPRANDSLPWRAPAVKSESAAPANEKTKVGSSNERTAEKPLLALARKDKRVQYDAQSRAARVDVPVTFDAQTATLTGEDKRQLDDVAKLLKGGEARELKVMVAGAEGARTRAVADYLDRHGIAGERLAVSGTGGRGGDGRASPTSEAGVKIYLLEAEVPVVGWEPSQALLR